MFPGQNGALGTNLGLAHLDPLNVLASPCTSNCFSCLRKQVLKNVAQPNPKWFFLSSSLSHVLFLSLFCPTSYNVECNLTYAIAVLMTLRLYRLMIIF